MKKYQKKAVIEVIGTTSDGDYLVQNEGQDNDQWIIPKDVFESTYKEIHQDNPTIENNFMYHSPKEGQPEKYTAIREKAKELAYLIDELCQNSREKSVAMTKLETTVMWANASIARNE